MSEDTQNKSFMDKLTDLVMKIAAPIGRFGMLKPIASIQDGLLACMPIVLNPYLMIPFVLSGVVGAGVGYAMMAMPIFGKFFVNLPWATPPFVLGPLGTGDIKSVLIVAIVFALGMLIYLPFWRLYVKHYQEEMGEETEA